VLFGKRRAYQRKVVVADFSGVCSGDIYVLESQDANILLLDLLPFICQTDAFFEHAAGTSAGSLSPCTNWTSLADFEFGLPSINEQLAIVTSLMQALDSVECFREARFSSDTLFERLVLELFAPRRENFHDIDPLSVFPSDWPMSTVEQICRFDSPICYRIVQVGDNDVLGITTIQIKEELAKLAKPSGISGLNRPKKKNELVQRSQALKEALAAENKRSRLVGHQPAEAIRYHERSKVERVNARLKDEFGGRMVRVRGHAKVMCHLLFGVLALTANQRVTLVT
jgi:hypothetical protein